MAENWTPDRQKDSTSDECPEKKSTSGPQTIRQALNLHLEFAENRRFLPGPPVNPQYGFHHKKD
jgi:hypothetical protein